MESRSRNAQGFEKLFANSFTSTLDPASFRTEVSLSELGGVQRMRASSRGAIDCVLHPATGLEFKAVRMPRKASSGQKGALYDVGQLTADFMRLEDCKKLAGGWVIAFVYGPTVIDCRSDGELYRAFHNQMFVDAEVGRRDKDGSHWVGKSARANVAL